MNIQNFKLLPEEVEIRRIENVNVVISSLLTYHIQFKQNVFITNKRVIIVNSLVPTLSLPFSLFYNKLDFDNSNKICSLLISSVEEKNEKTILSVKFFWNWLIQKWIIKDRGIVDIINKNRVV